MQEILIPKALITLFLFVFIIRPFIRKLKALNGLAWLPLLALLTIAALIPAYGFRPEAVPLFVYALVLSVVSISRIAKGGGRLNSFRKGPQFIFALPLLMLLTAAAGFAFYFSPQKDTALSTQGVYTLRERGYNIRIYTERVGSPSQRPLLVLLPPALGSLPAVDHVAAELRDLGFTVLTSERAGVSPAKLFRSTCAFFSGTSSARANARGRDLEDARKEDFRFILSWIRQNPQVDERTRFFDIASADAVFLAGYGAGGSALVLLEDSLLRDSLSLGLNIRGIIAIESSLWSVFRKDGPQSNARQIDASPVPTPGTPTEVIFYEDDLPRTGWFNSVRHNLGRRISGLGPQRIAGLGQVPQLSTPALFLVSDRSRESAYQRGRYRALLETFRAAGSLAVLASADGSGPLDFSDVPVRYPLISAFFPGLAEAPLRRNLEAPAGTATVITNFAADILESLGKSPALRRQLNPAGFQIESRNQ